MAGVDQLDCFDMILEARRNGLRAVGVAIDKLNDLLLFLLLLPGLESRVL
jgi:hypothetical protein